MVVPSRRYCLLAVFGRRLTEGETVTTITLEEAQAKLSQLLHQLAPGEEILITEGQRPMAKLVGQGVVSRKPRQPGSGKGKLIILEEDDEHLKDFEEYMD